MTELLSLHGSHTCTQRSKIMKCAPLASFFRDTFQMLHGLHFLLSVHTLSISCGFFICITLSRTSHTTVQRASHTTVVCAEYTNNSLANRGVLGVTRVHGFHFFFHFDHRHRPLFCLYFFFALQKACSIYVRCLWPRLSSMDPSDALPRAQTLSEPRKRP